MDVKVKTGSLLIGELAAATGASRRSIRYYEEKGLLDVSRSPAGYREYCPEAVRTIARIRRLLDAGFNLDAIAVMLPCLGDDPARPIDMCPKVAAQIRENVENIEAESADLARRRQVIQELIRVR
ncbi:MerR family transcriptional regulator [Brevibacterium sediminis]|uniref:MerR family transcriptional regulator n=1 Tax=Brevibacterium sediminis TaxID=1857024 RepID=A0ABQ1LXZ0_9MICO|nr:MerR family transcriptional regulator [Brevibacterium sediminis]GGC31466.1 MerR family transcriptional regulator [Brevibacterium sediminis]